MLQQMKSQISLGLLALFFAVNIPAAEENHTEALKLDRAARQTEQLALDAKEKDICGKNGSRSEFCKSARRQAKLFREDTAGLEPLFMRLEAIEKRLSMLEAKGNPGK